MAADEENSPSVAASHARIHVTMAVLVAVGLSGGWLYSYASQSADAKTTIDRVAKLEAKDEQTASVLADMRDRLTRIETKVDMLLPTKKADR